jgi:hypothetical protein
MTESVRHGVRGRYGNVERNLSLEVLEGHGFDNPENQIRLHRAIEKHFADNLGRRQAPEAEL